jgi:hypothetical protein
MMLSQYGGGISTATIGEICNVPLVTIIRLLGVMKKRLDPKSVKPGQDADPDSDAAMVAQLEARIKRERGIKV